MKRTDDFIADGDRYIFDSKYQAGQGWAQFDTEEDAWYFGQWINPFELKIITYAEGDLTILTADNEQEFLDRINSMIKWHNETSGYKFLGIDPGFNEKLRQKLELMKLPTH